MYILNLQKWSYFCYKYFFVSTIKQYILKMITAETQPEKAEVFLESPDIAECRLEAVFAKIRPFRQTGIRLEHEEKKGKHIFHNYGHGNSGIALAYGSAFMSVKSSSTYIREEEIHKCAVVGAGLIGLLTACQLAKNGHNVTLYSKNISQQNGKKMTFKMDDGLWLPFAYDASNKLQYELLSKITYQYYADCLKTHRYQSIKRTTIYDRCRSLEELKKIIPPFIYNGYKNIKVEYQNKKSQNYIKFRTFKINLPMFIEELKTQALLRGVKFAERNFQNVDELYNLDQDLIFNCTGYGSKKLFHDDKVKACIDHIIEMTNPNNLDYTIVTQLDPNVKARIHCQGNKILIRSQNLIQVQNIDKKYIQKLVQQTNKFFMQRSQILQAKI